MPQVVKANLSEGSGYESPVLRQVGAHYAKKPAKEFRYRGNPISPRQTAFCEILSKVSAALGSRSVPVDFILLDGRHVYLDRGCVAMAVASGHLMPLVNDAHGVVSSVTLVA